MANFLVYDFIMATQTESNDVSLDAKSCLSVPVPPSLFHGRRHPTCLSSTGGPNANQIPPLHDTFLRPKDVEVFSISGDGPCVSAFSPSAAHTHSLFPSSGKAKGDANRDTVTVFHRNEFR